MNIAALLMIYENISFLLCCCIAVISCHGRLDEPPSRNSAWRFLGAAFPTNYDDNGLANARHICGSAGYTTGERFATGKIVRTYQAGQVIDIQTMITSNHLGQMEMLLCPLTEANSVETDECFGQNKLEILASYRSIAGNIHRVGLFADDRSVVFRARLPDRLTCDHCVLQWRWYAKNTGEVFVNCADIAIKPSSLSGAIQQQQQQQPIGGTNTDMVVIEPPPTKTTKASTTTLTTTTMLPLLKTLPTPAKEVESNKDTSELLEIKFGCVRGTGAFAPLSRKQRPDFRVYRRWAVICFWTDVSKPINCDLCKENCLLSSTQCPEMCACRWYS